MSLAKAPALRPRKKFHLLLILGGVTASLITLIAGGVFAWRTQITIPHLRHDAEQRWSEIGRGMSEFEKKLVPIEENESLRALTRDLKSFGINNLYKTPENGQEANAINIPQQVYDSTNPVITADDVRVTALESTYLNEHAVDLDRLYQGVLHRDAPVWSWVPEDGATRRTASYQVAHQISQLICADALYKLELGDEKSAADAVAAGWKITSHLGEQPTLISFMIRAAIEGMFTEAIARLPEDPTASRQVALEVEASRERWRRAVQGEVWATVQVVDHLGLKPTQFEQVFQSKSLLEKVKISLARSFLQPDCAFFVAGVADHVKTSEQVRTLALSDLGAIEMDGDPHSSNAKDRLSEMWGTTWYRSWVRINSILLRREQAEIIRATRARVRAGESGDLGDQESGVVPGAKWHIVANAALNSASLQLRPLPPWTADNNISDLGSFLLPLDGSQSWFFRKRRFEFPGGFLVNR